ncbi:serine incorporator 3-like isoform X1 [Polypterus senegalus]|uniref:serine incorporator 3-like isoform X1 n=1 Tax=Polypterus senegalus TaxID=55291 RepID=UPI001965D1AA|nr:serine incorporator 3-like isoform X1 [Polypterus senegalus]
MGAVLGATLVSWVPCLCCGATCLQCSCCPNIKNSTVTRLIYASFVLLGTLLAGILLAPGMEKQLIKIPGFCERDYGIVDCEIFLGYEAVYRVCFGLTAFFALFAVLMFNVKTSLDLRAYLHNGYWCIKIAAIISLLVGAFFIPDGNFTQVWFGFGVAGAVIYILIQLLYLVSFAHTLNISWLQKVEDGNSKLWKAALICVMMICYGISIAAVVLLCKYYTTPDGCTRNKCFIAFNFIFCIVASIISILPKVQEKLFYSGLLQSSFITMYTMYLTWSAMTNEPDKRCNPSLLSIIGQSNSTTPANSTQEDIKKPSLHWMDSQNITGVVIFVLCIVYSAITSSNKSKISKLAIFASEAVVLNDTSIEAEGLGSRDDPKRVEDNEKQGVQYSYTAFHIMMCLASLYIMMTITNWYSPSANYTTMTSKEPVVWVKIASSWLCLLLYIWTMIAPLVCPTRDFS